MCLIALESTERLLAEVSAELPANDLFNLLDTDGCGHLTLEKLVEGMLNLRLWPSLELCEIRRKGRLARCASGLARV